MKKALLYSLAIMVAGIVIYFSLPCLFDNQADWRWRYVAIIALGHVLCLTMVFGSVPRLLFRLSFLPFCSPNWLSLQRIWIIWLGQWLFFEAEGDAGRLFVGFLLTAFGLMLDRLDGKMATSILASIKFLPSTHDSSVPMANADSLWAWFRVEQENEQGEKVWVDKRIILEGWIHRFTRAGTVLPMFKITDDSQVSSPAPRLQLTNIGDWLDPFSDKFNFLPLFCYLVYRDLLFWPVVVLMVSSDLFSTVIREPFLSWPGFRWLKKITKESKASPIGKTKVIWQIVTLLSVIPAISKWLSPTELITSKHVASYLLGLGLIAGILSIASRLTLWSSLLQTIGLRRAYQKFRKGYEHDVEDDLK